MNEWLVGDWICENPPDTNAVNGFNFHIFSYFHIHIDSVASMGSAIGFRRLFSYRDRFHSGGNYCATHSYYHWSATITTNNSSGAGLQFTMIGETTLINTCPPATPVNGPKVHSEMYLPEGMGVTSMREQSTQRTFTRLKL